MSAFLAATVLLLAWPGLAPAAEPATAHHYRVSVNDKLTSLDVHACFADSLPHHFIVDDPLARDALLDASILLDGERREVFHRRGALRFPIPSDDGCLDYRIDLEKVTATQNLTHSYRLPDALILSPQTWLWRPWSRGGYAIEFSFELPAGMDVSVPWLPLDNGPHHRHFRMADTPFDWPALMAVGRLHMESIRVPGGRLHMAVLPGPAQPDAVMARRWLKPAALAVSALTGQFPRDDIQLMVIPLDGGRDAAPWAQVTRGGGPGAQFYMNAAADWPVFRDDWIATHELSHLALPFVGRRDKWLSEGIASYYQNILRARVGLISEQEAWQQMADGFRRGRNSTDSTSLRDAALDMHSKERFMRVYWTGAAIAFLGDVELRRRTSNRWSLDRLIAELPACCMAPHEPRGKTWRARELLAEFDRLSGEAVFLPLHDEHVYSRFFPRLEEAWRSIGIEVDDRQVLLEPESAQQEMLRRSIIYPDAYPKAYSTESDELDDSGAARTDPKPPVVNSE